MQLVCKISPGHYHHSPSRLAKVIPSQISIDPLQLYIFRVFEEFFVKPFEKIFKFMVFKLLKNTFAIQNIESRHFHLCPFPD